MLLTGLSVLAFAAASVAAGPTPTDIVVDASGENLTVRIGQPTPLRVVLETVCERTEANCKLPAKSAEKVVRAGTMHGSWFEVVGELLQGSDLSFAATPPVSGRTAYLVVEPAVAAAHAKSALPALSNSGAGTPGGESGAEAPAAEAEAATEEMQPVVESSNDAPATSSALSPDSPLVSASTAAATPGANFVMTPFSDAHGSPLLSRVGPAGGGSSQTTPGMAVLPFSDEIGNPLVVPITNEPLSLTPFAGLDGQAWPAPVPQPNQKLEYPIPPTVLPASKPENQ
jgi:hypothetical protein